MSLTGIFPIERWSFNTQSVLHFLSEDERKVLLSHQSDQKYHKGDVIFREGAVPAGIFIIRTGKVKKYKVDQHGKEQIIYVANQGELIGYHAVLSEDRYADSAAALEECLITFIPKEDFIITLDHSPVFAKRLLKVLSHEFAVLANSISVFAQRSAAERLAIALIVLREKYKQENNDGEVVISISRADLASFAGIAQENVIRLLKEFKDEQIISANGRKIHIKDVQRLVKRTNYR